MTQVAENLNKTVPNCLLFMHPFVYILLASEIRYLLSETIETFYICYFVAQYTDEYLWMFSRGFHLPTRFTILPSELRDRYGLVTQFRLA